MRLLLLVLCAASLLSLHGCKHSSSGTFDLYVDPDAGFLPVNPAVGDPINITFTIHFATTYGSPLTNIPWAVTRDGVAFLSGSIPFIAANGTTQVSFATTEVVAGAHVYEMMVDPIDVFNETSFSDNTLDLTIDVAASPTSPGLDLYFSEGLACATDEPVAGEPIPFVCAITNATNVSATASNIPWSLSRDGVQGFLTGTISSILPNTTVPLLFTLTDTAGPHEYILTIDPLQVVPETDFTNNVSAPVDITVGPAPPSGSI